MNRAPSDAAGARPPVDIERASGMRVRWWRGVGLGMALVVTFLIVATIGAAEVQRGTRVLAVLAPVIAWIASSGSRLTAQAVANATTLGWATTAAVLAIAVFALLSTGRRGWPLLLLASAVSLTLWGQIEVLADRSAVAIGLYGAGFVGAIALGAWYPLGRLARYPPSPPRGEPPPVERRSWPIWELSLLFGLTLLALLSRAYALPEIPSWFDSEMTVSMLSSRTLVGLRHYLPWGLLGNSTGEVHLIPQLLFFHLFGTSVYALRLVAVLYGVAAVPLCYCLARRIAGTLPATVATLLLITAPEQLLWSRSEDTHFAPIAVAALVTVHLGLWLSERLSAAALLAAALWMPFCRFFYAPAMVLVAYPVGLYAHAVVFVRGAWRKAWYAIPLLAGGVALWVLSLSIVYASLNDWHWRFLNPAGSFAAAARAQLGEVQTPSIPEMLRLRTLSMAKNFQRVATAMTYHTGFSHWYVRVDESPHPTMVDVGLTVMTVLGIGYLLGQVYERRAFTLLLWVALGLLPALLSDDPADRRMSGAFPAFYIIIGVSVGAILRLARLCAGRGLQWVTGILLAVAVLGVAWTNLASHFLLRARPTAVEEAFRFTKPLFQNSDVIFHNLDGTLAMLMVFGNLDDFLTRPPCYQGVVATEFPGVALHLGCDFKDSLYEFALSPQRIAELQAEPRRDRISFLLADAPTTRPQIDLLRAVYPNARYHEFQSTNEELRFAAVTIDRADAVAPHTPALLATAGQSAATDLASRILDGVTLAPATGPSGDGLVVTGGLLIEHPGWYRFALAPACERARLEVDDQDTLALRPMLAGVHWFELTLPDRVTCALPVQLLMQSNLQASLVPIPAGDIVSPAVAAAPVAQAPPVATYDGYGDARPFIEPGGKLLDFGVDAGGTVFVFLQEQNARRVRRFSAEGVEESNWEPPGTQGYSIATMTIAPDGHVLLRGDRNVWVFDRDGNPAAIWNDPPIAAPEIAMLDDERSLSRLPETAAIAVLDRYGHAQATWTEAENAPGHFNTPASITVSRQGDILVIEPEGEALLFHNPPGEFRPQFVRRFHIAFSGLEVSPRGVVFDGDTRIILPDPDGRATLVYGIDGQHLMAVLPERDLNTRHFGNVIRYQAAADRLYVLDEERQLWVIPR